MSCVAIAALSMGYTLSDVAQCGLRSVMYVMRRNPLLRRVIMRILLLVFVRLN